VQDERLVVFADYVCPFCYLAEGEVARLRQRDGLRIDGAAFELRPAGTALPDLQSAARVDAWRRSVEPLAAELGVSIRQATVSTRTRKAHEAAAYARSEGRFDAMHEAIYAAYWREGRDIGRIDVLVGIGRDIGLDPAGLRVALDIDQWTARVEQDEAWGAQLRLEGVPAYVQTAAAGPGMPVAAGIRVGLRRYEELRAWVERE
jgi:predicted DsbA family dithiol-disulfide isomerase